VDRLDLAIIVVSVVTLLVGLLSAGTYAGIAVNANERKLRSLDRVGRGLIAAARVCAIVTLILIATVIITSE
jgi:fumarate reductase subunit C